MKEKIITKIKSLNTKNKLILSLVTLLTSILGGLSIAIILKNIVSIFIMLGVALSIDFLLEDYTNYKKEYCYELAEKYFNKIKNNIDENQVKIVLKKKVKKNKLWNGLFISSVPLSILLALILFCCNISLITSLTYAGIIIFTSFPITLSCMSYTSFEIDVLCEIIEKIENSKISTELAKIGPPQTTFKEEMAKLTYNTGISLHRYKYVPGVINDKSTETHSSSQEIATTKKNRK